MPKKKSKEGFQDGSLVFSARAASAASAVSADDVDWDYEFDAPKWADLEAEQRYERAEKERERCQTPEISVSLSRTRQVKVGWAQAGLLSAGLLGCGL